MNHQAKTKTYTVEEATKKLENYCIYQDRCHYEVEQKLYEMNMIPLAKEQIITHLIEHNFLNEERFAKSFARGKFRIKKYGRLRISQELKTKKISPYNIKTALKEIDMDDYIETLEKLITDKFCSIAETNLYKKKQKVIEYALRKGYEIDLIYTSLENLQ